MDPLDQPGVEASKKFTYGLMGRPGFESFKQEFNKGAAAQEEVHCPIVQEVRKRARKRHLRSRSTRTGKTPANPPGPFRLVKYFSYTGFLVILVFTLMLTIFISQQAQSLIIKKSEDYALVVADNLNHQVFIQFVLPAVLQYGRIRLRDPDQFQLLDAVVRNTIHSFKITRVNLYDLEGLITYSTEKDLIGVQGAESPPYKKALEGEHVSSLISLPAEGLEGLAGLKGQRYMRTFYPFRGGKAHAGRGGRHPGVFEIHQDLTADYTANRRFMYLSIAISLVFSGLLFVILRAILMRGESILEQRNEERRRLEKKLHQSERLASPGADGGGRGPRNPQPLGHHQQHGGNSAVQDGRRRPGRPVGRCHCGRVAAPGRGW